MDYYVQLAPDGYLYAIGDTPFADGLQQPFSDLPFDLTEEWLGCWRYQDGKFTFDEDRKAQYQAKAIEAEREEELAASRAQRVNALLLQAAAPSISDDDALENADIWRTWKAGDKYVDGEIARHKGGLYRLKLGEGKLVALAHQAPDAPGMNTLWVRFDATGAAGTLTDPIPFVVDMEAQPGLYYSYSGKVYKFIWHTPVLCHVGREPGAAGMAAFWEVAGNA